MVISALFRIFCSYSRTKRLDGSIFGPLENHIECFRVIITLFND